MKKVYDLTDTTSDKVRDMLDLNIRYGNNIYINGGPTASNHNTEWFFTNDQLKQLPFEPIIEDVSDVSFNMDSLGDGLDDLDMPQSTTQNQ